MERHFASPSTSIDDLSQLRHSASEHPALNHAVSSQRSLLTDLSPTLETLSSQEATIVRGGIAAPDTHPDSHPEAASLTRSDVILSRQRESRDSSDWSTALQNLLDQPPASFPLRVALMGMAFSGILGAWAWLGQVQEVSYAQGRLIPKGEVYKVQPVTQAEVSKVLVEEGQRVKAGEVIAELENNQAKITIEGLEKALMMQQAQLGQIQILMTQARWEMATQQAIAQADMNVQAAAMTEATAGMDTNQKLLADLENSVTAHQERMTRLQPLVDAGAIAQDHLFNVQQELRNYEQTKIQYQGELVKAEATSQQIQAQLAQKQAEALQSKISGEQKLQQLHMQLSQTQAKIAETESQLKVAQAAYRKTFLQSPVGGIVTALDIRKIGEVTQPGQTFAEIAPQGATLVLSAMLPDEEAGLVKVGMPVQLKFDAFPYQDYGIVDGEVTFVAADAIVDENIGAAYHIEVMLHQDTVSDRQQTIQFKAGQTATAEIVTRRRRILDVMLEPIRQLQKSTLNL